METRDGISVLLRKGRDKSFLCPVRMNIGSDGALILDSPDEKNLIVFP